MIQSYSMKLEYVSILFELSAITSLFTGWGVYSVALFLLFHYLACLLMAIAILPFLPERYRKNVGIAVLVFSSLSFLMFILGYITLWFFGIYLLRKQKRFKNLELESFNLDELFMSRAMTKERGFGEGPFYIGIRQNMEVIEEFAGKLAAIMMEAKNPKLMEHVARAISFQHDELRLSAFSLLFKLEQKLQERISHLIGRLDESLTDEERAIILFEIGRTYYDFVYLKIVDKELLDVTLRRAEDYVRHAIEIKENAEFYVLLGRIKLAQRKYHEAIHHIEEARSLGCLHPLRCFPYMAEAYYTLGKYEYTKNLMKQLSEHIKYSLNPTLYYVACFWRVFDGDSCK